MFPEKNPPVNYLCFFFSFLHWLNIVSKIDLNWILLFIYSTNAESMNFDECKAGGTYDYRPTKKNRADENLLLEYKEKSFIGNSDVCCIATAAISWNLRKS